MRAWASGASIAENTDRELIVVWCPDHHCEARLGDLWQYSGPVIEDRKMADLFRARAGVQYNYMEVEQGAQFQEPVMADHPSQDVFIRSAYSLSGPFVDFDKEQQFLQALKPVAEVNAMVGTVAAPSDVAVHVRMGTGPGYDHISYESPGNWPTERHAELTEWRGKSHVDRFITRLEQLDELGQVDTIFVAADLESSYESLLDRFGNRIRWLKREAFDRSKQQLQFALADLILLTKAKLFLASNWSSFSDVAQRLAPFGRPVEKSGIDF